MRIPVSTRALKPSFSARTEYSPAGRNGTVYSPFSPVDTVRLKPSCWLVTEIFAPAIRAPVGSTSLPVIDPVVSWPKAPRTQRKESTATLFTITRHLQLGWIDYRESVDRAQVLPFANAVLTYGPGFLHTVGRTDTHGFQKTSAGYG